MNGTHTKNISVTTSRSFRDIDGLQDKNYVSLYFSPGMSFPLLRTRHRVLTQTIPRVTIMLDGALGLYTVLCILAIGATLGHSTPGIA